MAPDNDGQSLHVTEGDVGGATAWGITIPTLSDYLGHVADIDDLRCMDEATRDAIYHKMFWLPVCGDRLPVGPDLMVFDFAVVAGDVAAIEALQSAAGVRVDHVIGPVTLGVVEALGPVHACARLAGEMQAHYQTRSTFDRFGAGWLARLQRCHMAALASVAVG